MILKPVGDKVVILGCGYTGKRVAARFLERGASVVVTARDPAGLHDLVRQGAEVLVLDAANLSRITIPSGALVLHSIPVIDTPTGPREVTGQLIAAYTEEPRRLVYLSTTGVYGAQRDVDETTQPVPATERETLRLEAEDAVLRGPWSSLVLRPAAIYGPGRCVHVAMQACRLQLAGQGDNFVSRIHVEDLATHVEAALLSDVTGAYPVGDELPCTSREIAEFCSRLLNVPMPMLAGREALHEARRADRRVDGRAIRARLGITLRYPTYREGIPASL
jgi:nucleoside-diphosphate-sugar epimerase